MHRGRPHPRPFPGGRGVPLLIMRARNVLPISLTAAALLALGLWLADVTRPAPIPDLDVVRAAYTPSEATLLDRFGAPLQTRRLDLHARRLAWTPNWIAAPAPSAGERRYR